MVAAMPVRALKLILMTLAVSGLAACGTLGGGRAAGAPVVHDPAPIVPGTMRPYQVRGRWYRPAEQPDYDERGQASWYGDAFHGRPTATGERFDMNALTAAHKTLPLPSLVEVTNLRNGRRAIVRVNDRGPFVEGRIIDLSRGAAEALDLRAAGVGEVRVRYLGRAPRIGGGRVEPASVGKAVESGPFWVQVGAYGEEGVAHDVARSLPGRAEVRALRGEGRTVWRVVLGPWDDANAAERARQRAVQRGHADALLISGR